MIRADKTKCIKCYKCLKVCPFSVLEKKDDGFPGTIKAKPCIRCMHCAATCPTDALTFDGKKAILDKKIRPLPDSFAENLKTRILTRRSYRHFEDRPVDDEIITEVLDYVRWAPSAKNQHPNKWIVVNSKQTI